MKRTHIYSSAPSSPTFHESVPHQLRAMRSLVHLRGCKVPLPRLLKEHFPFSYPHSPASIPANGPAHLDVHASQPLVDSPPPPPVSPIVFSPPPPSTSSVIVPWVYVTAAADSDPSARPVRRRSRVTPFRGVDIPLGGWKLRGCASDLPLRMTTVSPDLSPDLEGHVVALSGAAERLKDFGRLVSDLKASLSWDEDQSLGAEDQECDGPGEDLVVQLEDVAQAVWALGTLSHLPQPDSPRNSRSVLETGNWNSFDRLETFAV